MKAMVLAAGLGMRMRPLTLTIPKPLVPVAGVALIDRALDWLAQSGVKEAVVNTHYLAPLLEAHLAGRKKPNVRISHEEVALETGGGIARALPWLDSAPFAALNSDTICLDGGSPALHRLREAWDDATMDALLLLHPCERAVGYDGPGDFSLLPGGALQRRQDDHAPYVFTGVQLLHPRLFAGSPAGAFSMNLLYDRGHRADGALPRVHGVIHDGQWLHVGDMAGLRAAEAFFSR